MSAPPPFGPTRAAVSRVLRITAKELREILRDRRTLMTLGLMPLLLYPLLSLAFQRFLLQGLETRKAKEYRVGFTTEEEAQLLLGTIEFGDTLLHRHDPPDAKPPAARAEYRVTPHLERAIRDFGLDLGIRVKHLGTPSPTPEADFELDCELVYLEGARMGEGARDYIAERLRAAGDGFLTARLRYLGISQRAEPIEMRDVVLSNPEQVGVVSLASLIPVILILMTMTGAVYPAIDLTAGERERGTLEMLVAAPVPRLTLLFSKYLAVIVVASLTATVNLVAMSITLASSGLGNLVWGDTGISPAAVAAIFGLLLLFAAFFAAVLLTLTCFARSFKEAQAYLIPLTLFALSPGLASLIPGLRLTGWLAATPLLNVALLARDLLQGSADPAAAALVVVSTFLWAIAALSLAARIFGSESVLYESQGNWRELFRAEPGQHDAPRLSAALFCMALMFPLSFLLANGLARMHLELETRVALMGLATAVIFAGLPSLAACWGRLSIPTTFALRAPPLLALLGGVILGLSLWPWVHQLTLGLTHAGFTTFNEETINRAREFAAHSRSLPLALVLASFALAPAVCEEWFFRGYVYRALEARLRPVYAIADSALMFGLFHLVATDALAIERLIPSTLLGLVLGWLRYRSGSLLPGIALHFCHNGSLMLLTYYEPWLSRQGWDLSEDAVWLPATWLVFATAGIICGAVCVREGTRSKPPDTSG
ncbi:MAG TPA: ABC transporter permease subunit/CPBP intramembrane protease [Planctomycetaceae bacterium]|nr:ABC transporter permease subunit/CPBP intramembrane protease [Planctomycetaceae bacterium]